MSSSILYQAECVAEAAESQEGQKGPTPPQFAPKQSDSTESTFNPIKSAFPLGEHLPFLFIFHVLA